MIVLFSDLDLRGSGYMNITIALANQLVKRGRKVTVLGMGYSGAAHEWPFQIIPIQPHKGMQFAPAMLQNLISLGQIEANEPPEVFVPLLDIPLQKNIMSWPIIGNRQVPMVGVFPIESGPLVQSWANDLARMDGRLIISKYGTKQCLEAGLDATHIPIGLDTKAWRMPLKGEVAKLRESLGMEPDDFVVLTVADNQERKNLSAATRAIASLVHRHKINAKWVLVTRIGSRVGWELNDLFLEHDIMDRVTLFERGIEHSRLWILNAAADAFMLLSKAEGLCMPAVEAMACGTPIVVTDCTALREHLYAPDGSLRGFPVKSEYIYQDAWGNSYREFADPEHAAKQLKKVFKLKQRGRLQPFITAGRDYAESRTWDRAGDVLESVLARVIAEHEQRKRMAAGQADQMLAVPGQPEGEPEPLIPPTVPQAVPPMASDEEDGEHE